MSGERMLAIEVSVDDKGEIRISKWGHPLLALDPALDSKVSAAAQAALAAVSPGYRAELEASTHFLQNLDRLTAGIAKTARISDLEPDDVARASDVEGDTGDR